MWRVGVNAGWVKEKNNLGTGLLEDYQFFGGLPWGRRAAVWGGEVEGASVSASYYYSPRLYPNARLELEIMPACERTPWERVVRTYLRRTDTNQKHQQRVLPGIG